MPPGSVALVTRVHHAAIDGVSGADMMSILFDSTPEPRTIDPAPPRTLEPLPTEAELLRRYGQKFIAKSRNVPEFAKNVVRSFVPKRTKKSAQSSAEPKMSITPPPTPINHIVSSRRIWNTALLSLDRVKGIKDVTGTTLNDVVLAICSGALRRYLEEKGQLPSEPLLSMCPMSTRTKDEHGTMGNKISAMVVPLATHIEDPIARLKQISKNTTRRKPSGKGVAAKTLIDLFEFVPFGPRRSGRACVLPTALG